MASFDDSAWDASALSSLSASEYCSVCLVDNNASGSEKTKSECHFPVRKSPGGAYNVGALRAILGGRGAQANFPGAAAARATARRLFTQWQNSQGGGRSKEEFRAQPLGYELRDDSGAMPTLVGHLAVFNEWAEINSRSEGHFLERISPGAFTKTITENRERMRVLFQHGKDPLVGEKPLGPIASLRADDKGLAYEVPLLDTSYNRDLVEMLRADPPVLGSSFRFEVMREDRKRSPGKTTYNPRGLTERTVQEVRMSEFGPVTFPAYAGAG